MKWPEVRLDQVVEIGRGSSPRPIKDERYFVDGKIPWVKIADATASGKAIYKTNQYVNEFGASFSRHLKKGSVILSASGVSLGIPRILGVDACIHDGWLYFSNFNGVNPEWLYYRLILLKDYFLGIANGAAIQNINTEMLRETKISLPDMDAQQKIASTLSHYDDLIQTNQQRIALLEEAAQRLYDEWFVKLRFPNYQQVPVVEGVPEGWEITRLSSLGEVVTGKTPSTQNADYYGVDIPFIKTPDMNDNMFVIQTTSSLTKLGADSQANKYVPKNTPLISCIGTVGVVSLTSELSQFNQQINALVCQHDFFIEYAFFMMKRLKPILEGMGGGSTMANVSKGKLESLDVLKPSNKILIDFHNATTPFFEKILVLTQQNQKLTQARDELLPRLMSGQLNVTKLTLTEVA